MPEDRRLPRIVLALALDAGIAWLGGTILGEYPFQGEGVQYLAIFGGFGLGAILAWVTNRLVAGPAPIWLVVAVTLLAVLGEVHAVNIDTATGASWPTEGYLAVAGAGLAAAYGLMTARKDRRQNS
jgi:hypothetical protein